MHYWLDTPFLFIPAGIFLAILEISLDHFQVAKKLGDKYPDRKRFIKTCIHITCVIVAYLLTYLLLLAIYWLTGINLYDYGL